MEYWNNGFWNIGVLGYRSAKGGSVKLKMNNISINNPRIHHFTIPFF